MSKNKQLEFSKVNKNFLNHSIRMSLKKILIIEDEEDLCALLKSFLTRMNYRVYVSYTLSDGLKCIEDVSPDVIFLDNNLPDGLGWEKVDVIRQMVPTAKINLISAYNFMPEDLVRKDSVRFIEKPIRFSQLMEYL
jgi:DNA-binding response OmpR family regulator